MRAGQLDKLITIERMTDTVDDYGTPVQSWTKVASARAQIIQATTEEFMRGFGASSEHATVFRIRYLDALTLADRVKLEDRIFELKEIKEIGRRKGLELRCLALG